MNCQNCEKLEKELLIAQAAIAEHNKIEVRHDTKIKADLSALDKHDKEVRQKTLNEGLLGAFKSNNEHWNEGWNEGYEKGRKPLVDALQKIKVQLDMEPQMLPLIERLQKYVADALAEEVNDNAN
jgi:hypothetical protein